MTNPSDADRIKLAGAMGKPCSCRMLPPVDMPCKVHDLGDILGCADPFTDANDDYAVLEWMRRDHIRPIQAVEHFGQPPGELLSGSKWTYKVGDYARAALKVLNND